MRYADYACAWIIFALGIIGIVVTEILHPAHVVLDTSLQFIFLAMLNHLRLRNGYGVKDLKVFCIGANVATLALGAVALKMFGSRTLIIVLPVFCETIFSITHGDRPVSGLLS